MNEERRRGPLTAEERKRWKQLLLCSHVARGCADDQQGRWIKRLLEDWRELAQRVGVYDEPEPSKIACPTCGSKDWDSAADEPDLAASTGKSAAVFEKTFDVKHEDVLDGTDLKDVPPPPSCSKLCPPDCKEEPESPPCPYCGRRHAKPDALDPQTWCDEMHAANSMGPLPFTKPQAPPCPHCKSDNVIMQAGSDLETDGDYWKCRDCGEPNRVPYSAPPCPKCGDTRVFTFERPPRDRHCFRCNFKLEPAPSESEEGPPIIDRLGCPSCRDALDWLPLEGLVGEWFCGACYCAWPDMDPPTTEMQFRLMQCAIADEREDVDSELRKLRERLDALENGAERGWWQESLSRMDEMKGRLDALEGKQ